MASKIEKKLKRPDQFVTFWTRWGAVLAARKKTAALGTTIVLGIALAAWGGSLYVLHRNAEVSRAFGRIERIATAALIPATGDAPKFEDDLPHFKTEQERQDAVTKEIDVFIGANGGSPLKIDALLLRARNQLLAGKAAEAAATYQQVLAGTLDKRIRFLADEGLGFAHEAAGERDKALGVFSALAEDLQSVGGFYRDRALYNKARLLEAKGSTKEALGILREILEKSPTTSLRDEINDRVAVLEGK